MEYKSQFDNNKNREIIPNGYGVKDLLTPQKGDLHLQAEIAQKIISYDSVQRLSIFYVAPIVLKKNYQEINLKTPQLPL